MQKILKIIFCPIYIFYRKRKYSRAKNDPQSWADELHKRRFGYSINWDNPRDLNEKIRWLQFNSNTDEWSRLADKYRVRDYVIEKGYATLLVKLYAKWDSAEDIDFTILPNSFVLKTNHGCGEVIVVKDKSTADLNGIRKKMRKYLQTPFGVWTAEPHYLKIHPCIIAEELLEQDGDISTSLIDYKFFCFKGKPVACGVFYDRNIATKKYGVTPYDMDWHKHEEWRRKDIQTQCKDIPCPKSFELMKKACFDLASQFPFVRMDFYEVNGHPYFGEFTFTPAALTGGSFSREKMIEWGELINLESRLLML